MNDKLKRLLTPEGVRDLLPEAAERKRELEGKVQEIFSRWGYREVSTPAFEYGDSFAGEQKVELEDKVYRFLDERGRTLVLRPDLTLPLARVAATHLAALPKPLRLCYNGSVYRYATGLQGKQREIRQAGVELIGAGPPGSDAEVLALAATVLRALGLEDFTFCLGHMGFLDNLLSFYAVSTADTRQIRELFSKKDFVSLREFVCGLEIAGAAKEGILGVPALRGGRDVLAEAEKLLPRGNAFMSLRVLREVWDVLEDYGVTSHVTMDLGLVRRLNYYTGMVFEGYTGGLGYAICGGGRYDQLLGHFGPPLPAVGFALNIDHLMTVLTRPDTQAAAAAVFVAYKEGSRGVAVAYARDRRERGETVILDLAARDRLEAAALAKQAGAAVFCYAAEDNIMEMPPEVMNYARK